MEPLFGYVWQPFQKVGPRQGRRRRFPNAITLPRTTSARQEVGCIKNHLSYNQTFNKKVTIQYGLVLVAKRPFHEVTFIFFRMSASKAFCVKTGKRFEALRPKFLPVQQKAKNLPKKYGTKKTGFSPS
jgi:hypothetical protein